MSVQIVQQRGWRDGEGSAGADEMRLCRGPCRVYVPPFDHPLVVDGNATLVAELEEQLREQRAPLVAAVICSVGGGGLLAGVSPPCPSSALSCRPLNSVDRLDPVFGLSSSYFLTDSQGYEPEQQPPVVPRHRVRASRRGVTGSLAPRVSRCGRSEEDGPAGRDYDDRGHARCVAGLAGGRRACPRAWPQRRGRQRRDGRRAGGRRP